MTADSTTETIGQRLRRLRLAGAFSQRELSGPGVSYAYISRIEAGTRQPSVKALRILARKLGVSPEYLETGSDLRDVDNRELRLADAELALRLGGDPDEVSHLLEQLLAESERAGDAVSERRARIALGVAAFRRGAYADSVKHLEQIADPAYLLPEENVDVYTTLGQAYVAGGDVDRATALYGSCLDAVAEGSPISSIAYATHLSYALVDAGDLKRAREVVARALEQADHVTDLYSQVRVYWSAARLETREGRDASALEHIRHAIALLRATEDTVQLGRANGLAADIALSEGELEVAGEHLRQAERFLGSAADASDIGSLRTVQARWAAESGLADEAIAYAKEALALGGTEPGERANATWALAEALAAKDDVEHALERFSEAVELFVEDKRWRDASRVCRAWANVLRSRARNDEAFDVLDRAAELAARSGTVTAR